MTYAGFLKFKILCPKCQQTCMEPLRELVNKDNVPCQFCGFVIDLAIEEKRAAIREAFEVANQIHIEKPS